MNKTPFDLQGRIALITGGGRGIGREITRTLASAGADVAIAEIHPDLGGEAAEEVRGQGRNALAVETDVRDSKSVDTLVERVIERFGRIDILINNAGIAQYRPAEETSDEEWLNMMAVNLTGVFWCCRAVGQRMLAQRAGSIVNLASMSGSVVNKPQPQAPYNTSKAAVIMLTKSLAAEWAGRGVRVNSVSPGYVDTEMTRPGLEIPAFKQTWLEMTPMGRVGMPSEIACAVWYLASDAASFATGTNLIVDGGYSAW